MKNRIKVERAVYNLTQAKLAEMIGVSRQTINAMELNKYVPSSVLALMTSKIFDKNVNEIFFLDEKDAL